MDYIYWDIRKTYVLDTILELDISLILAGDGPEYNRLKKRR